MTTTSPEYFEFLHDSEVHKISLSIDEFGNRNLKIRLRCDPDCGYENWNDKQLSVVFTDPMIIHGDIFGYMSNAEAFNCWNSKISPKMSDSIKKSIAFGLPVPQYVGSVVFHSGSIIELACENIQFSIVEN